MLARLNKSQVSGSTGTQSVMTHEALRFRLRGQRGTSSFIQFRDCARTPGAKLTAVAVHDRIWPLSVRRAGTAGSLVRIGCFSLLQVLAILTLHSLGTSIAVSYETTTVGEG